MSKAQFVWVKSTPGAPRGRHAYCMQSITCHALSTMLTQAVGLVYKEDATARLTHGLYHFVLGLPWCS